MTYKDAFESLDKYYDRLEAINNLLNKLEDHEFDLGCINSLDAGDFYFTMKVIEDVVSLRRRLIQAEVDWPYKLSGVYHLYDDQMFARWEAKVDGKPDGVNIIAVLHFNKDDVPKGLLKAGCGIIEETPSKSYTVVCQK